MVVNPRVFTLSCFKWRRLAVWGTLGVTIGKGLNVAPSAIGKATFKD